MKLSKQEKGKLLETVRKKDEGPEADYAWSQLSWNHFQKLRLDLQHVHDYKLLDALRGGALDYDPDADPKTERYFSRYKLEWLRAIWKEINSANRGLEYLRDLVEAELKERNRIKRVK